MSTELPGVVVKEGADWTHITFKGKGFAWVDHAQNQAMIKARHGERDALLGSAPAVYEAGWTTNSTAWVRVRLERADPEEVLELIEEAWRMTATKRAIGAFAGHDCSRPGDVHPPSPRGPSPDGGGTGPRAAGG